MLQISHTTRIFVCSQFVDFRKGIDGLAALCRSKLDKDPLSGALFLFRNRSCSSIRVLIYDGQGFWLCTKRLSQGKFHWWPNNHIDARELHTLLWNGNPELANFSKDWKKMGV
jgi:transposase